MRVCMVKCVVEKTATALATFVLQWEKMASFACFAVVAVAAVVVTVVAAVVVH